MHITIIHVCANYNIVGVAQCVVPQTELRADDWGGALDIIPFFLL